MKEIFAKVGESFQYIAETCPTGFIQMQYERPTPEHIAQEGGTWSLPEKNLDELKFEVKDILKEERDEIESSPIECNGTYFDFDAPSRERMMLAIKKMQREGQEERYWNSATNEIVTVTSEDLDNVLYAGSVRSDELHLAYNTAKVQLAAAETAEEVENIKENTFR